MPYSNDVVAGRRRGARRARRMPSSDDAVAVRLDGAANHDTLDLCSVYPDIVQSVHRDNCPDPRPVPDKHVRIGAWLYVEKAGDPCRVASACVSLTQGGQDAALHEMQPWIQKMLGVASLPDTYASFTLDAKAARDAAKEGANILGPYYAMFCLVDVPHSLPNCVNRVHPRLVPNCFVVHGLNKRELTAQFFDKYNDVDAHVAKAGVSECSNKTAFLDSHRQLGYKRITTTQVFAGARWAKEHVHPYALCTLRSSPS